MKDLISERPNITPMGLGNSESTFDMSGYEAGYRMDGNDSKPASDEDGEDNMPEEENDDDDDDDDRASTIPHKRPAGLTSKRKLLRFRKRRP